MTGLFETDPDLRRVALRTPAGFLAFGFGAGLARRAPGTMGTLMAVPFAWLLKQLPAIWYGPALLLSFVAGVYLCGAASRALGRKDPGGIVWDEMVGYWLTVAFLPVTWAWWLAAFVLFRFFDIVKPWPINLAERRFGGGLGIMFDDIIAALYAMAVLAGFVNRIFALPGKLSDLEVISLSPGTIAVLDGIGIWAFFVVIGGFAVWVLWTFVSNLGRLRGAEVAS